MAITYVGSARATSGPNVVLTQTSTLPSGLVAGDLILVAVARGFDYPLTNATPSGWTRSDNAIDQGTSPAAAQVDIYYKFATGSDAAPTFTVGTASRFEVYAVAYRGVSLSTPIQTSGYQVNSTSSTTVSAGSITNTDAAAWAVFMAVGRQTPSPATYTPPTGMTERLDTETGDTTNQNVTCQWADTAGAVTTGQKTYSATLNQATGIAVGWAAFLNPQASAQNYTASPADTAGAADALTDSLGLARTGTDVAAATDVAAPVLTKVVGPDAAAATDASSRIMTMARLPADLAAITEQVTVGLNRADILNYQFVLSDGPQDLVNPWVPFGFGQTISVSKYDLGTAEDRTQDQVSPVADVRYFGTDRKTPPTWGFELYTDVTNESDALAWSANFEAVWDREDVRSTPGMVVPLRYKIADRVRRVYGRPGNFAAITTYARTGRVDMLCDFRLAENTYYDDALQIQSVGLRPSTRAGLTFPMTFPMQFQTPGAPRSETIRVGGTRATWVDITFYGSVQDPWVQIGNYRWGLRGTIALGQSVRMSGVPWQMGLLRSDGAWVPGMLDPRARLSQLRFAPGVYTVTMGGFGSTSTARADLAWRNAYGSI
jgi:hypothetical protein